MRGESKGGGNPKGNGFSNPFNHGQECDSRRRCKVFTLPQRLTTNNYRLVRRAFRRQPLSAHLLHEKRIFLLWGQKGCGI